MLIYLPRVANLYLWSNYISVRVIRWIHNYNLCSIIARCNVNLIVNQILNMAKTFAVIKPWYLKVIISHIKCSVLV